MQHARSDPFGKTLPSGLSATALPAHLARSEIAPAARGFPAGAAYYEWKVSTTTSLGQFIGLNSSFIACAKNHRPRDQFDLLAFEHAGLNDALI